MPLAYWEYSSALTLGEFDPDDMAEAARVNPGWDILLNAEFIEETERGFLTVEELARERFGIFDVTGMAARVVSPESWSACADVEARMVGPVAFGLALSIDHKWSTICAGGMDGSGRKVVDVVDAHEGTSWVVDRVVELVARHKSPCVVVDPAGPAGFLIDDLVATGVPVVEIAGRKYTQACGLFLDDVIERRLAHLDQPVLNVAVASAAKATVGDAFRWERKGSADISPLEGCTLALHGLRGDVNNDPWFDLS